MCVTCFYLTVMATEKVLAAAGVLVAMELPRVVIGIQIQDHYMSIQDILL
jgi:hypothetical protein